FDEDIFPFAKLHEYTSLTYDFLSTPIPTVAHEQPTTSSHTPSPTGPTNTFSQGPIHHATPKPINHAPPQPDITNAIQPTTSINTNTHMAPDTMPPIQPSTTNPNNVTPTQPQHPMQQPNIPTQTVNTHPMVTRAKAGISKPLERMNCHVTTVSLLPLSHVRAFHDPQWKQAMLNEYNALITNSMWVLVLRPANVNIVRSMWLFQHKFHTNDTLSRYKARLVANGRSQQQGMRLFVSWSNQLLFTLGPSLAGALQYLTFTRLDISYAVQQAGCLVTCRSTSGYYVFLGDNLLSWSAKRQSRLSSARKTLVKTNGIRASRYKVMANEGDKNVGDASGIVVDEHYGREESHQGDKKSRGVSRDTITSLAKRVVGLETFMLELKK
nr:ribonuclease H-like domain-containing protein [Tanacetum cinerariifolium]